MSLVSDIYLWLITEKKPFTHIKQALPIKKTTNGTKWWLCDREWYSVASSLSSNFNNGWGNFYDSQFLKNTTSRRVILIELDDQICIAKCFNYRQSVGRKIFRHLLFGRNEAIGLLKAKDVGLPVPKLFAYGETKHGPLCLDSIQLIEYIPDALTFPEFINQPGKSEEEGLYRIAHLIIKLNAAGCLHPDPHYEQFLLSLKDVELDRIIDFQYAQFDGGSSHRLIYQFAHLLRSLKTHLNKVDHKFLQNILDEILIPKSIDTQDKKKLTTLFFKYFYAEKDLPREKIMRIK